MALSSLPAQRPFLATSRSDFWWIQPLLVFLGFSAFIIYSTWAAFHPLYHGNVVYWFHTNGADYVSPFFSPEVIGISPHAWFHVESKPAWWPSWQWLVFSPAFLVLWGPGGFRFTCYYYRGAYYKGFWADPINCAIGEPRKKYLGEKYFPLILQNVHRYFAYLAVIFIFFLAHDVWHALWFTGADGAKHFGIGVGTIILTLNVIFLAGYTFGCHSVRHLVGGFLDAKSKVPTCAKTYNCVSCLNKRHMMWAWISLFGVGLTDLYVRLCAMGKIHDFVFFTF